jgi:hypothetical protein
LAQLAANPPRQLFFLKPQADAIIRRVGKLGYFLDQPQNEEHLGVRTGQDAGIAFLYLQPGRFADRSAFRRDGNGNTPSPSRIAYVLAQLTQSLYYGHRKIAAPTNISSFSHCKVHSYGLYLDYGAQVWLLNQDGRKSGLPGSQTEWELSTCPIRTDLNGERAIYIPFEEGTRSMLKSISQHRLVVAQTCATSVILIFLLV